MTKPNSALQAGGDETPVATTIAELMAAVGSLEATVYALVLNEGDMDPHDPALKTERDKVRKLALSLATPAAAAEVPTDELIRVARLIEDMKQECGMDPESPTAIRNSRLMSIAAILRGLASPVAPAGVMLSREDAEYVLRAIKATTEHRIGNPATEQAAAILQRAVLSAGAPAVPLQDFQDSVHQAADGSSRALRAASRGEAVGDGDIAPTQPEAPGPSA